MTNLSCTEGEEGVELFQNLENKVLIQIIDVSDKTLIEQIRNEAIMEENKFNEVKAKQ